MAINKVLIFNIRGKAAHFKKYYSNKSSLTYKIPPRTVLMGMVASILKYPRDSYYDIFSPEKAKFGVKIEKAGFTHFECMNYLKEDGDHTQVRLQLLLPKYDVLKYQIYFVHKDEELLENLAMKIKNDKSGYGLFLGQRQFRATAEFVDLYEKPDILEDFKGEISTLTYKKNIKELQINNQFELTVDNIPISFKKVKSGREPQEITEVCFEGYGSKISGSFKKVIKIGDENISFYTSLRGE